MHLGCNTVSLTLAVTVTILMGTGAWVEAKHTGPA